MKTKFNLLISLFFLSYSICAQPANNDCSGAFGLVVNGDLNCYIFNSSTLVNATNSADPVSCDGSFDDDVWFSFVAAENIHTVQCKNIVGSTSDLVFQLNEGACGSWVELQCHDTLNAGFNTIGLTIGNVYYNRVAYYSSSVETTTFDMCIGTLPPSPANDLCSCGYSNFAFRTYWSILPNGFAENNPKWVTSSFCTASLVAILDLYKCGMEIKTKHKDKENIRDRNNI